MICFLDDVDDVDLNLVMMINFLMMMMMMILDFVDDDGNHLLKLNRRH